MRDRQRKWKASEGHEERLVLEEEKEALLIIMRDNEHRKADSREKIEEIKTCELYRHCMYWREACRNETKISKQLGSFHSDMRNPKF